MCFDYDNTSSAWTTGVLLLYYLSESTNRRKLFQLEALSSENIHQKFKHQNGLVAMRLYPT